jgi:hypothetical protein
LLILLRRQRTEGGVGVVVFGRSLGKSFCERDTCEVMKKG